MTDFSTLSLIMKTFLLIVFVLLKLATVMKVLSNLINLLFCLAYGHIVMLKHRFSYEVNQPTPYLDGGTA